MSHSLRRTKAVLIYRRTGNLRAVQLLLGHSKIESTVRYLGIEVDDAIDNEKIDIRGFDAIPQLADVVGGGQFVADHAGVEDRFCITTAIPHARALPTCQSAAKPPPF